MSSTSPSRADQASLGQTVQSMLRWRNWPLVDHPRWSWAVPVGVAGVASAVGYAADSALAGAAAAVGLAVTLWQFWLPAHYEINPAGCSRRVLGRVRLVPWGAVQAYQPRATGIVLFRRADPAAIDALQSWFVPYPADEDEMLCMVRQCLTHAVELPA